MAYNMKLTTIFISLFLTVQVIAQPIEKIKQHLKNKNFSALNNYINNTPKSNVNFSWELQRTIVGDYTEGIIKIEEKLPSNNGTGGNFINNYSVYILTTKDKIFYYRFTKSIYKYKNPEHSEHNEETIDSLRDDIEYSSFENAFRQVYNNNIDHNDLFLTSIVYGSLCGIAGINPEYMEQLNLLVEEENIDGVRRWLKSANAEKQLYALNGYRILVNQGYNLTDEEKRIILIVEQKKGAVSTCSGCLYMNKTFQDVVSEINSIPTEYLKPNKSGSSYQFLKKEKNRDKNNLPYWWLIALSIVTLAAGCYFIWRTNKGNKKV